MTVERCVRDPTSPQEYDGKHSGGEPWGLCFAIAVANASSDPQWSVTTSTRSTSGTTFTTLAQGNLSVQAEFFDRWHHMGLAAAEDHANAAHACFDGQPVSAEPVHVPASFSTAGAVSFGSGFHRAWFDSISIHAVTRQAPKLSMKTDDSV